MRNKKFYAMLLVAVLGLSVTQGGATVLGEESNEVKVAEEATVEQMDTFADGGPRITSHTDFFGLSDLPAIAQVGKKFEFGIERGQRAYLGDVRVVDSLGRPIGDIKENSNGLYNYTWTPNRPGVFYIKVYEGEWLQKVEVASRKIYVNSDDKDEHYQLSAIQKKTWWSPFPRSESEVTTGSAYSVDPDILESEATTGSAYSVDPTIFKGKEKVQFSVNLENRPEKSVPTIHFRIGEAGMWAKTVKPMWNTITEGFDFSLGRGNYQVLAEVRGLGSVEAEDMRVTSYTREHEDGHKIVIKNFGLDELDGGNYRIDAYCKDDKDCVLEYAFLKEDDIGLKQISKEYSSDNTVKIQEDLKWDYDLIGRVKHAKDSEHGNGIVKIGDSYEAQKAIKVEATGNPNHITISSVDVETSSVEGHYGDTSAPKSETTSLNKDITSAEVIGHNKNLITVNAKSENSHDLMYKAWVVNDGVLIPLGDYSESNTFVYYPQGEENGEEQKLIVSVRSKNNGGKELDQVIKEYTLKVQSR